MQLFDCQYAAPRKATVANQYQTQKQTSDFGFKITTANASSNIAADYKIGERVKHKKFGVGIILNVQSVGSDQRLEIAFDDVGTKNLMAAYASLNKVG